MEVCQQVKVKTSTSSSRSFSKAQTNLNQPKKRGSDQNRDILSAIALGKKEKESAVQTQITNYWINGQFAPLGRHVHRVFGRAVEASASSIRLSLVTGKVTSDSKLQVLSNRDAWTVIFDKLNGVHAATPFRGEKRLYLSCINQAILVRQEKIEIDRQEMGGSKGAYSDFIGNAINDVAPAQTLTAVFAWLAIQDRVGTAELRARLLPLDVLTSAFVNEINELALDLTGELALEEAGNDIVVARKILVQILGSLDVNQFEK